jgi:FkbM family methyltransferase
MISYAQNREDAVLARVFEKQPTGFYIDVGAHHPTNDSITRHFYDRGWRGINIEPGETYAALARERPRDINLHAAVSNSAGEATYYEFLGTGLSTLCTTEALARIQEGRRAAPRLVQSLTLASICQTHAQGDIDFISIDVEGHEREVIAGGDWRRWRPRVAVVESTRPNTTEASHASWEPLLLGNGYTFAVFDGLSRFYVRDEDRSLVPLLTQPLTVLDQVVPFSHVSEVRQLQAKIDQLEAQLDDIKRAYSVRHLIARSIKRSLRWFWQRRTKSRSIACAPAIAPSNH